MFMPEANDVPELVDDDAKLIAVVADRNRLRTVAPFPDERATTARPDLMMRSKAGYRVTLVACRWAGAVIEGVFRIGRIFTTPIKKLKI